MLTKQNDNQDQIKSMLAGVLKLPGYVDDVAKFMIALAKSHGPNRTVECTYGKVVLHARADSTVCEIRRSYERQCSKRFRSPHCRHLRLIT